MLRVVQPVMCMVTETATQTTNLIITVNSNGQTQKTQQHAIECPERQRHLHTCLPTPAPQTRLGCTACSRASRAAAQSSSQSGRACAPGAGPRRRLPQAPARPRRTSAPRSPPQGSGRTRCAPLQAGVGTGRELDPRTFGSRGLDPGFSEPGIGDRVFGSRVRTAVNCRKDGSVGGGLVGQARVYAWAAASQGWASQRQLTTADVQKHTRRMCTPRTRGEMFPPPPSSPAVARAPSVSTISSSRWSDSSSWAPRERASSSMEAHARCGSTHASLVWRFGGVRGEEGGGERGGRCTQTRTRKRAQER
eukprot:365203-Chlamydomonas_euryale.AAC.11